MTTTQHTQLPWKSTGETWEGDGTAGIGIESEGGRFVAFITGWTDRGKPDHVSQEDRANAEFIVRACNAYDELVAACEGIAKITDAADMSEMDAADFVDNAEAIFRAVLQARAAIAKAVPNNEEVQS